jgi:tRNA(Ser,Leu) C12 N-acetylase TAN1
MTVKDDLKEQAKQILSRIEQEEQSMLVILKRQEDGKRYSVDDILLQAKDRVLDRLNMEYNNIQIKLERLGV